MPLTPEQWKEFEWWRHEQRLVDRIPASRLMIDQQGGWTIYKLPVTIDGRSAAVLVRKRAPKFAEVREWDLELSTV